MTPNEYAELFEEIHRQFEALLEKITASDYCEKTPRKDFQRDIAAALELGQKKQDLYTELLDDESTDKPHFAEYCKRFDKIMEQHGNIEPAKL